MFHSEQLQEKWAPLLNHEGLDAIKDSHRRAVTAVLLENQEKFLREQSAFESGTSMLTETPNMNTGSSASAAGFSGSAADAGPVAGFDPVLISLIRRSMPNLVAYDLAGVQPMNGPTGLIFAMRSRYENQSGDEAFFNEVDSAFSGQDAGFDLTSRMTDAAVGMGSTAQSGSNPSLLNPTGSADNTAYNVGQGMGTEESEALDSGDNAFNQMAFSIEKVTVTAKSRALKAEYSLELAQDLKAIHGLNAEAELANILSTEILSEINREVIRTIYKVAEQGAVHNTATQGVFDLDIDSNGRWSVEKFKGLLFQIERPYPSVGVQSFTFINPMGEVLIYTSSVFDNFYLTFGVTALISTIVGSFVYSLISNNLRIEWFANKHDFFRHFIGAVLIGIGGVLSLGCTIGQGVSGVSTLAIGSIITLLSIIFGASLMMKIEYYKAVYEESSFIELLKNALIDLKVLPGKLRTLEKI
jgi:hypothetical protein